MRTLLPLVAASGLLACGGATRSAVYTAGSSPTPTPAAIRPLALANGTTQYRGVTRSHVEQVFNGQQSANDVALAFRATGRVTTTGSSTDAQVTIDSADAVPPSTVPATELARIRGVSFGVTLSEAGRFVKFQGPSAFLGDAGELLASSMRQFFPRIPRAGVTPGSSWLDTMEVHLQIRGLDITVTSFNQHEAEAPTAYAGKPALPVRSQSTYRLAGSGQQQGQVVNLDGQGTRDARHFLALGTGAHLGFIARDSSAITVSVAGGSFQIPIRQLRVDSVTTLP